ncbi:MAG: universal stress protein [Cytophagales bacterium]|nr:universal stress protein [Cytophagales bacterium]
MQRDGEEARLVPRYRFKKVEVRFPYERMTYHFSRSDEVEDEILRFVERVSGDLLVMTTRRDHFPRLFSGSHTRRVSYHTHLPLLVLHA